MEHVAIFAIFRGGGGGYITIATAMDIAAVKHGCSFAENEIYSAFDITILVVLARGIAVGVEGVLTAEETAVAERSSVTAHKTGHSLTDGAGTVFKRNVLRNEIRSINVA